jgi:DNA-binding transcriptional MerR regulator
MITSKDILETTGIKSAKTLTRWHQRGLIPPPVVRTHPSGRGKMSYWPDWVMGRCTKIVELQREGYSFQAISKQLDVLDRPPLDAAAKKGYESISDFFAKQTVRIHGQEVTQAFALRMVVLASVQQFVSDSDSQRALFAKIEEIDAVDLALRLARSGFNPILLWDGEDLEIVPDFLIGRRLSNSSKPGRAFVVAPVMPALRGASPFIKELVGTHSSVWPAPKVWMDHDGRVIEYVFSAGGPFGFEFIEETAKDVGTVTRQAVNNDNPGDENGQ